MIKEKVVKYFDREVISTNSFITYGYSPTSNEGVEVKMNGIIKHVDDKYFTILDYIGNSRRVTLQDIENNRIKILGIKKDVSFE